MDVQRQIDYWRQGSQEDMEAADALLEHRKIRQALFFGHLSLEKILKAHVTGTTGSVAPRTHDLLRLADLAGVTLADAERAIVARLQRYCQEGRYPDLPLPALSSEEARRELEEMRRLCAWFANRLS